MNLPLGVRQKRVFLSAVLLLSAGAGRSAQDPEATVLLRSSLRFDLNQQVVSQARMLTEKLPENDAADAKAALTAWSNQHMQPVRDELSSRFGDEACSRFEQFYAAYTEADSKNDPSFLQSLNKALGLAQPYPEDFATLKQMALTTWLQTDIEAASKFLTDLQTWLQLRSRSADVPPLKAWLARDVRATGAAPASPVRQPPPQESAVTRLAGAEAPLPEFKPDDEPPSNPLDSFTAQRKERRDRIVKEAQEGMQQVAAERQGAEEELAARKQAEAQAEAEAIKNHAQQLAAAEQQAMEQAKNSWSSKLKGVLSATISAGVGAFTGGVGTQAGAMAADAIFNRKSSQ